MGHLGLDPEFSIRNKNTGRALSAHHVLGDEVLQQYEVSGDHPGFTGFRTSGHMNGAEIGRDGAAVEVRSKVRSSCRDNIIPYVAEAMRMVQVRVPDGYEFSSSPVFTLEDDDGPEDIRMFGCAPDYNGYTLSPQTPLLEPGDLRRYTGGHVHVSYWPWAKNDKQLQSSLAILLDAFIGLPMVAILGEPYREGEAERREFYGKAGSFRWDDEKGKIEYRTLSGRLLLNPFYLGWVLGNIRVVDRALGARSIGGFADGGAFTRDIRDTLKEMNTKFDLGEIRRIINEHDVSAAEALYPLLFQSLPNWSEDDSGMANKNMGGGTAAYHPYVFKTMVDAFVEANHLGLTFRDDMQFNWGLYDDYRPTHHRYWGIHGAFTGQMDNLIFPMREVAMRYVPEKWHEKTPTFTHPTVGGGVKWVGSPSWLS